MRNITGKTCYLIIALSLLFFVGCKEKGSNELTKGIFLQTDSKYMEAITCFDEAIEANPSLLPAYSNMMECWFQLEKGDSIVKAYEKIYNNNKDNPVNSFAYGCALKLSGELDSSLVYLNQALNHGLKESRIYCEIGNIFDIRNDTSKAREFYEKSGEGDAVIGLASYESDEKKKVEYYVKSIDKLINKASGYYTLGLFYSKKGKNKEAMEWFKKVSDWGFKKNIKCWQNMHLAAPLVYLADEFTAQVLIDVAIEKYKEALQLKDDWAYAHSKLAWAYYKKADYDNAIKECERAKQLSTNHALALNTLAAIYTNKNESALAETYYQKLMKIDPCGFDYNNLAILYTNRKEYDKALAVVDKGSRIRPRDYHYPYLKGNICFVQKKYDEAINDYRQALSPKSNDNFFNCDLYQVYTKAFVMRDLLKSKYLPRATKDTCLLYAKKAIAADPENIRAQVLYNTILNFKTKEDIPIKRKAKLIRK
ncbi:MAG TPA: tetratricopeptide repeat protein [bacterium]